MRSRGPDTNSRLRVAAGYRRSGTRSTSDQTSMPSQQDRGVAVGQTRKSERHDDDAIRLAREPETRRLRLGLAVGYGDSETGKSRCVLQFQALGTVARPQRPPACAECFAFVWIIG
jgi:hypothetical protein